MTDSNEPIYLLNDPKMSFISVEQYIIKNCNGRDITYSDNYSGMQQLLNESEVLVIMLFIITANADGVCKVPFILSEEHYEMFMDQFDNVGLSFRFFAVSNSFIK